MSKKVPCSADGRVLCETPGTPCVVGSRPINVFWDSARSSRVCQRRQRSKATSASKYKASFLSRHCFVEFSIAISNHQQLFPLHKTSFNLKALVALIPLTTSRQPTFSSHRYNEVQCSSHTLLGRFGPDYACCSRGAVFCY